MGSGKTTLGEKLAQSRGIPFYDSDAMIEAAAHKSISAIFQEEGETGFRKRERDIIFQILTLPIGVISIGGGAFVQKEIREALLKQAQCIYLKASAETLYERVKGFAHRPLLQNEDPLATLKNLLQTRSPFYEQCHQVIETEQKSVDEMIGQLVSES